MASSLQDWLNDERKKRQQAAQAEQRARSSNPGNSDMATQPVRQPTKAPTPPKLSNPGNSDMATQPSVPKWKSTAAPTVDRQKNTGGNPGIGEAPPSWRSSGPPAITQRVKDELTVGAQIPNWRNAQPPNGSNPLGYGSTSSPTINKPNGPPMPQDTGPILPSWRSAGQPMGGRMKDDAATFGPPKPATDVGPMMPSWRSGGPPVLNGFGDREPLYDTSSSGLQIGMSTPRVNTGPTQIGSLSAQPKPDTVQAPETSPWQLDRSKITGGNPLSYGQPTKPDATGSNPLGYGSTSSPTTNRLNGPPTGNIDPTTNASVWRRTADVIGAGVPLGAGLVGNWLKDTFGGDPNAARTTMGYPVPTNATPEQLATIREQSVGPGEEYYKQYVAEQDKNNPAGFDVGDLWRPLARGAQYYSAYVATPIQTEKIPGTNVSAGQLLGAGIDATQNVLNANAEQVKQQKPGDVNLWAFEFNPQTAKDNWQKTLNTIMHPVEAVMGNQYAQQYATQLQKSIDFRKQVEALPPEQKAAGQIALSYMQRGTDAQQAMLTDMLGKDQKVADLNQKAQEAQDRGDALAAAQYGQQAAELKNKTNLEVADDHQNFTHEFLSTMLLDPSQYLPIGEIFGGIKNARRAAAYNPSATQAVGALDEATKAASKLLEGVAPGTITDIRPWYQKMWNPAALRTDAQVGKSTGTLWQAATQLLGSLGTQDKAAARSIIQAWVDNPKQLIESGQVGGGMLANPDVLREMPILQQAAEKLKNLGSLAGDGQYVAADVASELENVFQNTARSLFGKNPIELPAGTASWKLVKDGVTGKIQYFDKGGKVISETAPDVLANVEALYKTITKDVKGAQASGLMKGVNVVQGFQKGIMGDMFLNLRPANWLRNAANFTATAMVDGEYSAKATPEITGWWAKKLGEFAPNLRVNESLNGEAAKNWTRAFWPNNNPYASLMENVSKIPYGMSSILGRIPVGEQKAYLNFFDTAGQRAFSKGWRDVVNTQLLPKLADIGLPEDMAKFVADHVFTEGMNGSRQEMAAALKEGITSKVIKQSLESLGIPSEVLSLQGQSELSKLFKDALPGQADQAAEYVRSLFASERNRIAKTLLESPPQPGVYEWTKQALTHDGAEIMDSMGQMAQRAGIDPAQATEQGKNLVQQVTEGTNAAWDAFRQDLAQSQNPNAASMAVDLWHQYTGTMQEARLAADAAKDTAIRAAEQARNSAAASGMAGAPNEAVQAAWKQAFDQTQKIWQDAGQKVGQLFQEGRGALLNSGEYTPKNSWQSIVDRFVAYDDAAIAQARNAGQALGATSTNNTAYKQVMDAGRQYVDKSVYELFEAYKRAPTMDNYDLMVDAIRKYEQYGQQVAQHLAPLRESALAKGTSSAWAGYFAARNAAWAQAADNAVLYNNVQKRIMVANGVAEAVASKLQWTDDFAGGTFKLIGKADDATWQAMNTATGEITKFADPATFGKGSALPPVPENIIKDFNQAIGGTETIVDDVIKDIGGTAGAATDSTKGMKIGDTVWRGPNGDVPVPNATPIGERDGVTLYDIGNGKTAPENELYVWSQGLKLRSVADSETMRAAQEVIGNAPDQIASAREAAATMRAEWDRVARANKGYLKLENAAGMYVKDGIARVPENKFADLYGETVGGRVLNNQSDIEAFLEEYAAMKRQAAGGESALQSAQREYERAKNALELFREANPYTVNPANPLNLHGVNSNTNLYEQVAADTATSLRQGGAKAPEYGNIVNHGLEKLRQAEEAILAKLPEILQGKPNSLTPAQQVAVLDEIQHLMPHYDNVTALASKAGQTAADFVMLNSSNQRNFDAILSYIMPYHYFATRSARNWAIRVMEKPAIAHAWYEAARAIQVENQQQNLPTRMQGSIPNPLAAASGGWLPERITNPMAMFLPLPLTLPDKYEGEDAPTAFEKYAGPAMRNTFPIYQYAIAAALDKASPLPGGKKRTDEFQISDYVPLAKIAGSVNQAMTGQTGQPGFFNTGDQWDAYRNARQVATMGEQGDIAKITGSNDAQQNAIIGKYADQIAQNIAQGKPANADVPREMFGQANKVYIAASKQVGFDQARSQIMSWLTGVGGHDVQAGEQALRQKSAEYGQLGYGPENQYGSKEAKREFIDQNPMLSTWWGKNATVPGAEGPAPAASAQNDQKNAERNRLYADMNKAAEAYLQSHPEADKQELAAIKAPYYDQINALDAKYPNAAAPEGSGDPTKGMSPAERAQWELDRILKKSEQAKPEYPVGGTPQQLKDYYAKLNEFTPEQRASVERSLNGLLAMDETEYPGIGQWKSELRKLVGNKYASEIIRYDSVKRASATEQDWSDRMAVVKELTDLQREKAKGQIVTELGQTAYDTMQAYYALPKEQRKQYKADHPEVGQALMIANNPDQYSQAKKLFGDDVWKVYYDPKRPAYPGDNASDADKKAYYAKLDAYNKANPRSEEIRLWVNGRSRPEGTSGGTVGGPVSLSGIDTHQQIATTPSFYDFGSDWAEAKRIFGNDIFKTVANFPQTDDKKVIGRYLGAHPELTGYWQWKKDLIEHPERAPQRGYTWDVPSQTLRDAVQGQPRPLGSGAQPIGSTRLDVNSPNGAPQPRVGPLRLPQRSPAETPVAPTELPNTQATAAATTGTPAAAADGTSMDALDYARQDPKFVKREAISAQIAAQNAAVTKQFGQDTFNLYQQYTDLPKDSDARKQFMKDHPEVRGVMAWMYGRSADRDKNSTTPPEFDGGKDYEEAKKRFGDDIWDLYGQYNKDWSKVQKKAFFGQHPEYGNFMDWWYGDDGKGEYTPRHQKVPSGHVRHGQNRGKGKRRGGYWLGQWYIDENGVAHLGGPDGPVGKGPSMGDSSGGDAPQMIGAPENNGPTQSGTQMIGAPENNGPGDVPATLQELQMIGSAGSPTEAPTPSRPAQGGAPVGGYWLGSYFIDMQGVAHEGGPNGPVASFGKGNGDRRSYQLYQRPAYVDPQSMSSALRVGENDIPQRWRPEWASRGWMNAGQDLAPERLQPMRWR